MLKGPSGTLVLCACLLLSGTPCRPAGASAGPVLERVADIPLPGPASRFDYQSIDTTANRLYISHMGAGEIVVFDLGRRRVEATVSGLPRVTGVCAVPSLGKVYASVAGSRQVAVIDARTLRVDGWVGRAGFPDGIAYAASVKKIYVSDESGGGELVLSGERHRVVATIPLAGEAGNTIYDPTSDRILVAVQSRNEVVEIDPRTDTVVARHRLRGASRPHGMCLDGVRGRLFVANEGNASLLTVDRRSMQVVDSSPVGQEPDVLAFDGTLRRLYVASESGRISIYSERGGGLAHEGDISLPHAHTVSVDPRTHLVYLPLQDLGGRPVLRIMRPARRD